MYECNAQSVTDVNLLDQVLRQGESLRSSIIKTIFENEPFYNEKYSNPKSKKAICNELCGAYLPSITEKPNVNALSTDEKHKVLIYMNGDPMSKEEEQQVLETFRSLSSNEICDLTSRSFTTTRNSCDCSTCRDYCKLYLSNSTFYAVPKLRLKSKSLKTVHSDHRSNRSKLSVLQTKTKHDIFEYVDSLKVLIHNFMITDEGKMKIHDDLRKEKSFKPCVNFNDLDATYFVEYEVPRLITLGNKKMAKVDSGLNNNNFVKKCSKSIAQDAVHFKQSTLHDIHDLNNVDLDDIEITFKVSCRILRQKKATVLGTGVFTLGQFYSSSTLSTLQEVVIHLDETPIITGTIKVQVQLGCNRLYFGRDFIDSVLRNKENRIVDSSLNSEENLDETFTLKDFSIKDNSAPKTNRESSVEIATKLPNKRICKTRTNPSAADIKSINLNKPKSLQIAKVDYTSEVLSNKVQRETKNPNKKLNTPKEPANDLDSTHIIDKIILFGFIYISRVEYSLPYQRTYFTCQPFCQNDFVQSNVTRGGSHPYFNFHQVIPYIYDDDFVFKLRENHMIFEFFEKKDTTVDKVIGISKIPLHQYYLAFRNPVIIRYLNRNKLPVIGTDWYEPIVDISTGEIVGNYQILVALGSEAQVKNLQLERGFMDDIVTRAKNIVIAKQGKEVKKAITQDLNKLRSRQSQKLQTKNQNSQTENISTPIKNSKAQQDKSTIVTPSLALESKSEVVEKSEIVLKMEQCDKVDNRLETIQNYLQQLVALKSRAQVESTTQTQEISQIPKSPSGQKVLVNNLNASLPSQSKPSSAQCEMNIDATPRCKDVFKAQIVVESALHLPARKKCRVKKIKGKTIREELLPSTYVSYEIKDGVVKTSQVIQKSTSPTWNMRNEVSLPVEFLTNSNRRLLFKVWKKSNNGSTIPNMQIDTIIGFATVDITVLLAGLPTIEGWFNIMDFSNKCNGQIKINVTPLENITKYTKKVSNTSTSYSTTTTPASDPPTSPDAPEETISRALKRKFIELDEISQRLKSRLNHVTSDINESDDTLNDESADEFEKDINTLCVEEDYDLLDFAKEAQDMNLRRVSNSLHQWQQANDELMVATDDSVSDIDDKFLNDEFALHLVNLVPGNDTTGLTCFVPTRNLTIEENSSSQVESQASTASSSVTTLDRHLAEGKDRIDHLLQKLTLISSNSTLSDTAMGGFSGRYVSGCSISQEAQTNSSNTMKNVEDDILTELGIDRDFDASKLFNASLENFNGNLEEILGRVGHVRDDPDGEGNTTESSNDDKLNDD